MTVTSGSKVEVRLPSRLGFEKVAMSTAAGMAKLMGFSEDRIEDLKTAVAEACINAMEHGNQMNASIPVSVVLSMKPDDLEVKVMDNASGIALVIQVLMEANKSGQTIAICGLTPHFTKVFTMVGITKYATLYPDEAAAVAAL